MLLGTGLVGGIMRNNGRFTATEEMIAMGGGELFLATDRNARHSNVDFPGHRHASLYDVSTMEPSVRRLLVEAGVKIHLKARVREIEQHDGYIVKVAAEELHGGPVSATADAFVDASGTAGPMPNCLKYGNGCAMCIIRCPTFGARLSIAGKAGVPEVFGEKPDGTFGAMSGSCKLLKESLSSGIREELNARGVCVIPVPAHLRKSMESLGQKACQQYAMAEFAENIVLLDTGHAKLMTSYYPLDMLRQVPRLRKRAVRGPLCGRNRQFHPVSRDAAPG